MFLVLVCWFWRLWVVKKNTSYHNAKNVECLLNYVSRNVKGKIPSYFSPFLLRIKKKKNLWECNFSSLTRHVHIDIFLQAWKNWREGTISNLIDPTLSSPITEIMRCIHIGLLCVQENVVDRPNMASIVLMINNNSIALTVPTQPASIMASNVS